MQSVSMTSISISKQTASIDKQIFNSRERHAPKLRSGTVRALKMNDNGCNASGRSCPHRIPLYEVSGSSYNGCFPPPQLNPPLSTMIPPRPAPWPPTHLVNEETTISAPCSKGLHK